MLNGTLTLVRGDDQDVGVTITNTDGSAYNLSGCSIQFTARQTNWSSPIILQKTTTGHIAAESGLSRISFASGDTFNINDMQHYYDVKLISSVPTVTTLIGGPFYVVPAVTSSTCRQ